MAKLDNRIKKTWLIGSSGVIKQFKSMYAAAVFLDVSKGSITYNMDKDKTLKNFFVVSKNPKKINTEDKVAIIKQNELDKILRQKELNIAKKKKQDVLEYWVEETEAVFRRLGYYDPKKLFSIKKSLYPYGAKVN